LVRHKEDVVHADVDVDVDELKAQVEVAEGCVGTIVEFKSVTDPQTENGCNTTHTLK
jgi:hypothetical protein